VIKRRRRVVHQKSFAERLAEEAAQYKEAAEKLPEGKQRELYLRRAQQAEAASQTNACLS
jgi:hypothetical protein